MRAHGCTQEKERTMGRRMTFLQGVGNNWGWRYKKSDGMKVRGRSGSKWSCGKRVALKHSRSI